MIKKKYFSKMYTICDLNQLSWLHYVINDAFIYNICIYFLDSEWSDECESFTIICGFLYACILYIIIFWVENWNTDPQVSPSNFTDQKFDLVGTVHIS